MAKLFSLGPYGTEVRGFGFVHLEYNDLLVSELLMDYGGEPVSKHLDSLAHNDNALKELYIHIITAHYIMESQNLAHLDIKEDNILFKEIEFLDKTKMILPIFIDFDIAKLFSISQKLGEIDVHNGYSEKEASPEQIENVNYSQSTKVNPWKSQIYSCSFTFAMMIGFNDRIFEINKGLHSDEKQFRKTKDWQQKVNDFILKIADALGKDKLETKKLFYYVLAGLEHDPNLRPTTIQLLDSLSKLDSKSIEEIKNEIDTYKTLNTHNYQVKIMKEVDESEQIKAIEINLYKAQIDLKNKDNQLKEMERKVESLKNEIELLESQIRDLAANRDYLIKILDQDRESHKEFDRQKEKFLSDCRKNDEDFQKQKEKFLSDCRKNDEVFQKQKEELTKVNNDLLREIYEISAKNTILEKENKGQNTLISELRGSDIAHPNSLISLINKNSSEVYRSLIHKEIVAYLEGFREGKKNLPLNFPSFKDVQDPLNMFKILVKGFHKLCKTQKDGLSNILDFKTD